MLTIALNLKKKHARTYSFVFHIYVLWTVVRQSRYSHRKGFCQGTVVVRPQRLTTRYVHSFTVTWICTSPSFWVDVQKLENGKPHLRCNCRKRQRDLRRFFPDHRQIQKYRRQDSSFLVERVGKEAPREKISILVSKTKTHLFYFTLVGDVKLNDPTLVGVVGGVTSLFRLNDCNFFPIGISFWASNLK